MSGVRSREVKIFVTGDHSGAQRTFQATADAGDAAQSQLQRVGEGMASAGKKLSIGLTAPLLLAGKAVGDASQEMNAGMANVATLIPNATERVVELKGATQDLAISVGKSTTDLTGGLYQVVSAFGDSADSVGILETNAKAAKAGLAQTVDSINLTSAVTKAYGDTSAEAVQKAADLALLTVRLGQTTFPELAASIGRVTPLTAALNVSQEELFGTMATFTGVTGGAAEVSTQLRGVLQSLMAPTADMSKLLGELGFASGQAMVEQLGLQGTIDAIVAAAEQSGQPLAKYVTSIEGQTLALAASGGQADAFTAKVGEMSGAAGTLTEAFDAATGGINKVGFSAEQAAARAEVARQKLGDALAPAMAGVYDTAGDLSTAIMGLTEEFELLSSTSQKLVIGGLGIAVAAGPALYAGGKLIGLLGSMHGGYVKVVGGIQAMRVQQALARMEGLSFGQALSSRINPAMVGYGVAAAGAIIGLGLLVKHTQDLRREADHLADVALAGAGDDPQAQLAALQTLIDETRAAERGGVNAFNTIYSSQSAADAADRLDRLVERQRALQDELDINTAKGEAARQSLTDMTTAGLAYDGAQGKVAAGAPDAAAGIEQVGDAADDAAAEVSDLAKALEAGFKEFVDPSASLADTFDPLAAFSESLAEQEEKAQQAAQDRAAAVSDANQRQVDSAKSAVDAEIRALRDRKETGKDASDAHNKAIDNQIAKLEDGKKAIESSSEDWKNYYVEQSVNVGEFIDALDEQADGYTRWQRDLRQISQRVSADTLSELRKLGEEGAPLVALFASATDEQIGRLEQSWDSGRQSLGEFMGDLSAHLAARDEWTGDMQVLATRVSAETLEALAAMGPEGARIVDDMVDATPRKLRRLERMMGRASDDAAGAWASGLEDSIPGLEAIGEQLGHTITEAIARELGHAPTRVSEIMDLVSLTLAEKMEAIKASMGSIDVGVRVGINEATGGSGDPLAGRTRTTTQQQRRNRRRAARASVPAQMRADAHERGYGGP